MPLQTSRRAPRRDAILNETTNHHRAAAVHDILTDLGVDSAVVTVRGIGSDGPGHITDVDKSGRLLP